MGIIFLNTWPGGLKELFLTILESEDVSEGSTSSAAKVEPPKPAPAPTPTPKQEARKA